MKGHASSGRLVDRLGVIAAAIIVVAFVITFLLAELVWMLNP
jgi:hypothetical protein